MSWEHRYPLPDLVILCDGLLKALVDPRIVEESPG